MECYWISFASPLQSRRRDKESQFPQLMQQKNRSSSHFSQRTENLASALGVLLKDLPVKIGISERMFYAYRSGGNPISDKAWRKLEQAEVTAEAEGFTLRSFRSVNEATTPPLASASSSATSATSAPLRFDLSSSSTDPELLAVLQRIATALERLAERE